MEKGYKALHIIQDLISPLPGTQSEPNALSCIVAKQSLEILHGNVELLRHSIHSQQVALLLAGCCITGSLFCMYLLALPPSQVGTALLSVAVLCLSCA